MVKDFTIIIVGIVIAVTVITYKALDMGHNGLLLNAVFTFLGTVLGAVTLHYSMKWKAKATETTPGGE